MIVFRIIDSSNFYKHYLHNIKKLYHCERKHIQQFPFKEPPLTNYFCKFNVYIDINKAIVVILNIHILYLITYYSRA